MPIEKIMRRLSILYAAILIPLNLTFFVLAWGDLGQRGRMGLEVLAPPFIVVTATFGIVLARAAATDAILLERRLHLGCLALGASILVAQAIIHL